MITITAYLRHSNSAAQGVISKIMEKNYLSQWLNSILMSFNLWLTCRWDFSWIDTAKHFQLQKAVLLINALYTMERLSSYLQHACHWL